MWPSSLIPLLALLIVGASAGSTWDNFPVKSVGMSKAPQIEFYVAPPEGTIKNLEDAHPVHGIETSDGGFVLVGKGIANDGNSEAFAAKLDKAGKFEWSYVSGKFDAFNSVVQLPGGDLIVAGFRAQNSVYKRMLVRLPLTTTSTAKENKPTWTGLNFGDTAGSHGAFEIIDLDSDKKGVLLGGVHKRPSKQGELPEEMSFKSYGNVPDGKAIVMHILITELGAAPTAQSATWTAASFGEGYVTVKALRPLPNGNTIALLYGEEGNKQAALVELSKSDGTSTQGPKGFGVEHGEGTDLAVVPDGTGFAISGHGDGGVNGALSGRITRVSRSLVHQWSKSYRSAPTDAPMKLIKNECWGIQALADGFVLACGTGVENCRDMTCPKTVKTNCQDDTLTMRCNNKCNCMQCNCLAGKSVAADTRPGAPPRPAAVWQSMAVRTDSAGNTVWQRVDQFREADDPALGTQGWEARSSASEHVIRCADGSLAFVQDEVSGIGLMKLEKPASEPTKAPTAPTEPVSTTTKTTTTTTPRCCDPDTGPGPCPGDRCWDEGGVCCSDGSWYPDVGDGSTTCQGDGKGLQESKACGVVSTTGPVEKSTAGPVTDEYTVETKTSTTTTTKMTTTTTTRTTTTTTPRCCDPDTGPGPCPGDRCWDEGGVCCSDGSWYSDVGDGSTTCQGDGKGLQDSKACEVVSKTVPIDQSTAGPVAVNVLFATTVIVFPIMH